MASWNCWIASSVRPFLSRADPRIPICQPGLSWRGRRRGYCGSRRNPVSGGWPLGIAGSPPRFGPSCRGRTPGFRSVNLAFLGEGGAEVIVGVGVIRFQADGLLELLDRLLGSALPVEGGAKDSDLSTWPFLARAAPRLLWESA